MLAILAIIFLKVKKNIIVVNTVKSLSENGGKAGNPASHTRGAVFKTNVSPPHPARL